MVQTSHFCENVQDKNSRMVIHRVFIENGMKEIANKRFSLLVMQALRNRRWYAGVMQVKYPNNTKEIETPANF